MERLTRFYEANTALLRLSQRQEVLAEELKQAKFDLRSRDQALFEYQGSLRYHLDGFSGKREEKMEALRLGLRRAETALNALQQEQQRGEQETAQYRQLLQALPSLEELRKQWDPKQWAVPEAAYCAEALAPLLEENRKALMEYRSLLRGEFPMLSLERQVQIETEPNLRAERCLPWLDRMEDAMAVLEKPFDPGEYYRSPAAYVVSAAARHNRLDRVNDALDQVERLQKQMRQMM